MAINIKDEETSRLARQLSKMTGNSITGAVRDALKAAVARVSKAHRASVTNLASELDDISKRCAKRTVLDKRSPEELLGYNDDGMLA